MGRPREHDESTRRALLDAAEHQLKRGEPLSVRGVADAVATTTRAVYSLFGSMDGLYQALVARGFDEIRRRVEAIPLSDDPAADLVRAGVDGFRSFAIEHPNLFRLSFEHLVPGIEPTPEVQKLQRDAVVSLHARVVRCCEAGLFGARAARDVTWEFHAICQGLASVELMGWLPDPVNPARLWRDALGAFVAGLAIGEPRATHKAASRGAKPVARRLRSGSGR